MVDVQPGFLNARNRKVIGKILSLLKQTQYDLYVESLFYAEKGSLWHKQQNWYLPKNKNMHTEKRIAEAIKNFKKTLIIKQTKSVFKGKPNLFTALKKYKIEEVHIVGLDTNDCVFATACEAFDLGFYTYIIEECCQSSSSDKFHKEAVDLLRGQCMTNNSIKGLAAHILDIQD